MKLKSLFFLFFCLCASCANGKKSSPVEKTKTIVHSQDSIINGLSLESTDMTVVKSLPLGKINYADVMQEDIHIKNDTLFLLSFSDFLLFPFGEFDHIDDFLARYPGWNLDREKKIYESTYYILSDGKSQVILADYGDSDNPYHLNKIEVLSASLHTESALLDHNIRVGISKIELLECFMDVSQIADELDNFSVLYLDLNGIIGVWMYFDFSGDILVSIKIECGAGIRDKYLYEIYSLSLDVLGDEELYFGADSSLRKFTNFNLLDQYTRFNDGVLSVVTAHPFLLYPFGRFNSIEEFLQKYPSFKLNGIYLDRDYYHYYILASDNSNLGLILSEGEDLKLVDLSIRDKDIILANNIRVGISKKELLNCLMDIDKIDNWESIEKLEAFSAVDGTHINFYFEDDDTLECIAIWGSYDISQKLFDKLTGSYD